LLALLLALAACATIDQSGELSAEEIRQAVLDAAEGVGTLRFDSAIEVRMRTEGAQSVDMTVSATTEGRIDNRARVMKAEMVSTVELPQGLGGRQQSSVTVYLVDDVLHSRTAAPNKAEQWSSQKLLQRGWDDLSQLGTEMTTLRTAQVELLGTRRLRGVDCYLLGVTPDTTNLRQRLAQVPGLDEVTYDAQAELDDLIQAFSTKWWVAQESFYLLRDETEITIVLDADALNLTDAQQVNATLDAKMQTDFTDYDQPLTIELPPRVSGSGTP
jgi:hypothetical protein